MPSHARSLRWAVALAALLVTVPLWADDPPKAPEPPRKPAIDPGAVEARFTDNSTLKMSLRDQYVEVATKYGLLRVPVADVRRIDFGTRISDEVATKIEAAITNLGSSNYRNREAAQADLLALREKAFPALARATKHKDPEVIRRAEELLNQIRESVPEELLDVREFDVVHTDDMKVSGRITGDSFKAHTAQFGEQSVKLTDLRSIRSMLFTANDVEVVVKNAIPDPGTLTQFQNIGQTMLIRVTGANNGTVWGTDMYTTDSSLAAAAVHAGAVRMGQTAVVKVTIVASPNVYMGTTRNGITTNPYGQYPSAYTVQKVTARDAPGGGGIGVGFGGLARPVPGMPVGAPVPAAPPGVFLPGGGAPKQP